jgi:hypothetical protein
MKRVVVGRVVIFCVVKNPYLINEVGAQTSGVTSLGSSLTFC